MIYDEIGQRIKKRRLELDITARELARRTSLSASFISQLERGKSKISLESLRLIAEHLDISMLAFLEEDTPPVPAPIPAVPTPKPTSYEPITRSGKRAQLTFPDSGVSYELLTRDLSRSMEAMVGHLAPGTGNIARRLRMPTEEFIYVLSGSLLVELKSADYTLNAGDTIYFEGEELIQLVCVSKNEDAVWLSVITPPAF